VCDRGPSERECEALASTDERTRELAALRVNVRVLGDRARRWCRGRDSEDDFEDLHFSHGYRRTLSVADLLDDPSADLSAIADANRAFEGCVDRGVLVPWVETPVCTGSPVGPRPRGPRPAELRSVEGPAYAPCLGLDTVCARGRLDASGACCSADLLPAGTVCGEGALCDGAGGCVDAALVPEASRVAPSYDWVAMFPSGVADGLVPSAVAGVVPTLSPPAGLSGPVLELRAPLADAADAVYPEGEVPERGEPTEAPVLPTLGAPDVLALVPASLESAARVTIVRTAPEAVVHGVAYDGPLVPHALVVPPRGSPITSVWVARGPLDELPAILSDGTRGPATLLSCEGTGERAALAAPGSPTCTTVDGHAVVVGADVTLVWVPDDGLGAPFDVLGAAAGGTPIDLMIGGTAGDFRPPGGTSGCIPTACGVPGGCSGARLCVRGRLGPCVAVAYDVCNGIDDNCNGRIDEGGAASCNDNVGCTADSCALGTCRNRALPYSCVTRAICEVGVCTDAAGVRWVTSNASLDPAVPMVACPGGAPGPCFDGDGNGTPDFALPTGCDVRLGHGWCTTQWDSCDCNGPEVCAPAASPAAAAAAGDRLGCVGSPLAGPDFDGTPEVFDACDDDGNACTVERACCELTPTPGNYCRTDAGLPPSVLEARRAACAAPGNVIRPWDRVPGFPVNAGRVRCSPTNPLCPSLPRCMPDLDPCTIEGCNPASGACLTPVPRTGSGPAETIPSCNPLMPDTVGPDCDGDREERETCADETCQAGFCNEIPDTSPTECGFDGCSMTCVPGAGRPPIFGLATDCTPGSDECAFVTGCVDLGAEDPGNVCMVCDPDRDPWGYSPRFDAAPCDDANACTVGDQCDGSRFGAPLGECLAGPPAAEGTRCDDGQGCSISEACDGTGRSRAIECVEICGVFGCPDAP
jgi:hypothetical protein